MFSEFHSLCSISIEYKNVYELYKADIRNWIMMNMRITTNKETEWVKKAFLVVFHYKKYNPFFAGGKLKINEEKKQKNETERKMTHNTF